MIEMLLVGDDGVEIDLDTSFIGYSSTNPLGLTRQCKYTE